MWCINIHAILVCCIFLLFQISAFLTSCPLIYKIVFAKVKRRGFDTTLFYRKKMLKQNLISTHSSFYLFVLFTLKFITMCFWCDSLNIYVMNRCRQRNYRVSHVLSLNFFIDWQWTLDCIRTASHEIKVIYIRTTTTKNTSHKNNTCRSMVMKAFIKRFERMDDWIFPIRTVWSYSLNSISNRLWNMIDSIFSDVFNFIRILS